MPRSLFVTVPDKFDHWALIERAVFDRGGWLYVASQLQQTRDSLFRYARNCRYLAGASKGLLAQINAVKPEGRKDATSQRS